MSQKDQHQSSHEPQEEAPPGVCVICDCEFAAEDVRDETAMAHQACADREMADYRRAGSAFQINGIPVTDAEALASLQEERASDDLDIPY